MICHEGKGWRLELNESKKNFPVLIGGENWAVELSKNEWEGLALVVFKLIDQYDYLKNSLMREEKIFIEIDIAPWWACIDGTKEHWRLKLILSGEQCNGRGLEIFWPEPAAQAIVSVMRIMWDSYSKKDGFD